MVLDVITISRRQPRLRSQKGAKIIFSIRSGFIRLCVYSRSRDSWKMRDSFPQPTFPPLHLAENSLLGGNCCEKRRGGEGKKKRLFPRFPEKKKLSPTWCLTFICSQYRSRKRRLFFFFLFFTLGEIEGGNFQRVTSEHARSPSYGEEKRGKV